MWRNDDLIANPAVATATVIKPYLQLQGYAHEPLVVLSYDLTNAAGLVTNELAAVVDQYFDTNAFDFTTNYFQAYDVALSTNLNEITLTVSDRAGNLTVTNVAVTLDYATATNPPTLQLLWPTSGMNLSGDSFYVRGLISDETANVTALWVDTNGVTNEITGLVERNGIFWVDDLPLADGTNEVILVAKDAAGNLSNTNLSVVKSSVALTITSTPEGESLYTPLGTVSGTISDVSYTVSVNGVSATVYGDGSWLAENVPVLGQGTATFDAVATPSGGGGVPTVKISLQKEMPAFIAITKHFATLNSTAPLVHSTWTKAFEAGFTPVTEGLWQQTYRAQASSFLSFWDTTWFSQNTDYAWSEADPVGTYHTYSSGMDYSGAMTENDWQVKTVPDQSLDHSVVGGTGGETRYMVTHFFAKGVRHEWPLDNGSVVEQTASARTKLTLSTGGKAGVGRKNFFCLSASAGEYGKPWQYYWLYTPATEVAYDRIQVMGKPLGSDYRAYLVQPDNVTVTLPLTVSGAKHFSAGVAATKHRLVHNTFCTALTDSDPERLNLGVGEGVWFFFNPPLNMPFPEQPWWLAFEGSVSPTFGEPVAYTAPSNATAATVRVFVRDVQLDTTFSVKEPTGIDIANTIITTTYTNMYARLLAAARMHITVFLAPTTVSFDRLECVEVGEDATNVSGYFTNFTRTQLSHKGSTGQGKGDVWIPINCDNSWDHAWDELFAGPLPMPAQGWYPGHFTWPIPGRWRIAGTGSSNDMVSGWQQDFWIDANGTVTIKKFENKTVERTTNNVVTPAL